MHLDIGNHAALQQKHGTESQAIVLVLEQPDVLLFMANTGD